MDFKGAAGRRSSKTLAACIDALERRTLLSAPITANIPVLLYHQDILKEHWPEFTAQMHDLHEKEFNSISLDQYYAWRNDNGTLPDRPFIAFFDDAFPETMRAAEDCMDDYGYTGVISIITKRADEIQTDIDNDVHTEASRKRRESGMSWGEINGLVTAHNWDIASHSRTHSWMGDGDDTPVAPLGFRNTPADILTEARDAKSRIAEKVGKTPIAFVHPHDDATARSLAVLSEEYPMVFASSTPIGESEKYIGHSSGLQNGQLVRMGIYDTTTPTAFLNMLTTAMSATTFTPPILHYTTVYRDREGTIIANGAVTSAMTPRSDVIVQQADGVIFNNTPLDMTTLRETVNYATVDDAGNAIPDPGITGFDAFGGGGNDSITIEAQFTEAPNAGATLVGGDGNDTIFGSSSADSIAGDDGADNLSGGSGNDTIVGGLGNDTMHGDAGNDQLLGGPGADLMYGDLGNDSFWDSGFYSDGDRDTLIGGLGVDHAVLYEINFDVWDDMDPPRPGREIEDHVPVGGLGDLDDIHGVGHPLDVVP